MDFFGGALSAISSVASLASKLLGTKNRPIILARAFYHFDERADLDEDIEYHHCTVHVRVFNRATTAISILRVQLIEPPTFMERMHCRFRV